MAPLTALCGSKIRFASAWMPGQVRVHLADRLARAAVRGRHDEVQVRVPGDQPQQLAAGIPARADHRDTHRYRPFDPWLSLARAAPRPRIFTTPHALRLPRGPAEPAARIIMHQNV